MISASATTRPEAGRSFSRVESCDFDEIAHALGGMNTDLRQVSPGPFHGTVELASIGSLQIMRVAVNRVIQARGAVRANTALFSLVTPTNQGARWRNQYRRCGDINMNPPSSEIDHLTGPQYDNLTVIVDADRFREAGGALAGVDVASCLEGPSKFCPASPPFAALKESVQTALDLARSGPESLGSPADRARIEETLTGNLLAALAGEQLLADDGPALNSHRLARRAEGFMLAALRQPLLMKDLCEELDVSERTLRYAFGDFFGVSPLAYFKMLKLNAIRRMIADSSSGLGVQEIARQFGVVHLGNFAADYRRQFGELPSATARQGRAVH